MMFCSGSKVKDLVAGGVAVDVDVTPSYMQHHKYFVFDDRVAIHGSVNLSYHAMVSGGILAIHEDPRIIQPLARHFANVKDSTIYRLVGSSELQHTKPCPDCEHHARVTGSAVLDECVAVERESEFCPEEDFARAPMIPAQPEEDLARASMEFCPEEDLARASMIPAHAKKNRARAPKVPAHAKKDRDLEANLRAFRDWIHGGV